MVINFGLVDLHKGDYKNDAGQIIGMLMSNYQFSKTFGSKSDDESNQARSYAQQIIKKVELASKSTGLPIGGGGSVEYSYKLSMEVQKEMEPIKPVNSNFVW